jgi:chromate transporter
MQVSPPRSLTELFLGFLSIGARSFGGVMPWAHRVMVEERRWVTPADFTETIGLCQFLPGPNVGNASIVYGKRWFGVIGSLVAFLGLFALPFVWVLTLFVFYADFAASSPLLRAVVTGRPIANNPVVLVIITACFLCVAVARISLIIVLPVALGISLLLARRGKL